MQSPGCLSAAETGAALRQTGRRRFAARLGKLSYFCRADVAGCQDQQGSVHVSEQLHLSFLLLAALEHPPKFPVVWTDGCDISAETFVNGATGLKTLLLPPHH